MSKPNIHPWYLLRVQGLNGFSCGAPHVLLADPTDDKG